MTKAVTTDAVIHQGKPILHILCGKIASGKSTLSSSLASSPITVVISEDQWLFLCYGDEMKTIEDYVRCSAKLKNAMKLHVISLLKAGVSVVLDFPANTVANRKWMMGIINESCADHILHYLNVSSEICKSRLQARNQSAAPHFVVTDEQFELISQYFTQPEPEEGFNIIQYN